MADVDVKRPAIEGVDERDPENIAELYDEFKSRTGCRSSLESLRFIRSRKYDVNAAVVSWVATTKWRAANGIEGMHLLPPPKGLDVVLKLMPERYHGFAKDGSPLYIGQWGKTDFTEFSKRVRVSDFLSVHFYQMEGIIQKMCPEGSKRPGGLPNQCLVTLLDLKGFGLNARRFFPHFKAMSDADTAYYPETLGRTLIVNAPAIFPTIWGIVKSWLDPFTASKVQVYSDCPAEILKYIDADQLPVEYGGTCACPGGCVKQAHTAEQWKEEDLKNIDALTSKMKLREQSIPAGAKHKDRLRFTEADFDVKVNPAGVVDVEYFFRTASYDIKFSVEYTPSESVVNKVIIPLDTFKSHEVPIFGTFTVSGPGMVEFLFDNSYSWYNAKTLTYGYRAIAQQYTTPEALAASAPESPLSAPTPDAPASPAVVPAAAVSSPAESSPPPVAESSPAAAESAAIVAPAAGV